MADSVPRVKSIKLEENILFFSLPSGLSELDRPSKGLQNVGAQSSQCYITRVLSKLENMSFARGSKM